MEVGLPAAASMSRRLAVGVKNDPDLDWVCDRAVPLRGYRRPMSRHRISDPVGPNPDQQVREV